MTAMPETVRSAVPEDAGAVAAIYSHYAVNTIITFEEEAVPEEAMRARMLEITRSYPWLVAEDGAGVAGYAYAYPWKARAAYRHTVESGIYLRPDALGRGWGTRLYGELLHRLEDGGVHAVIAGIAMPNPASIALHEKMGFVPCGRFPQVGFKLGRWIDVGYWGRILGE